MFCTDALENVLVFLFVKAAQLIPAEAVNLVDCGQLVPELFDPNRGVRVAFRP